MKTSPASFRWMVAVLGTFAATTIVAMAQQPVPPGFLHADSRVLEENDYIIGPQDALIVTSYDQPELSGRFIVEADGTFTYPLIGRVPAGGMTLRDIEAGLEWRLKEQGFLTDPQIMVAIAEYKSQKIFIVGEVREPGAYPLTGDMRLIEALARAGSTLPTASGEVVIVRAGESGAGESHAAGSGHPQEHAARVNLRDLEDGQLLPNVALRGGDTVFVLRAQDVFVFGQVRNPGAYPLPKNTMVLQALSLAGGITDRGTTSRMKVVRTIGGETKEFKVLPTDFVQPGDTIVVPQRFF